MATAEREMARMSSCRTERGKERKEEACLDKVVKETPAR